MQIVDQPLSQGHNYFNAEVGRTMKCQSLTMVFDKMQEHLSHIPLIILPLNVWKEKRL